MPSRAILLIPAVGLGGGLIGAGYMKLLALMQRGLWPDQWGQAAHLGVFIAVGLAVALMMRVLGDPGDVELLVDNIHVLGGAADVRALRSLIPISLLCIASGGAAGPEAPLVQTTGSLGTWLAGRGQLGRDQTRVLTITGMAAGFTVLFGTPMGAAIFTLEILHRRGLEYYEALMPAVIGSLCGYAVYVVSTGMGLEPVWRFPHAGPLHVVDIGWSLVGGLAGAIVAMTFIALTQGLRRAFLRLPQWVRPILGGLALGGLAFASPYALTFGEVQVNGLLASRAAAAMLVVAVLAKLAGTSITISSGWRGGFIIPLFFIGVALGRLGHLCLPHTNEVVLMAALMAAINVGVTKTPLGSTIVVSEMAGMQLLPTTLIAAVLSLMLTRKVGLIASQRQRLSGGSVNPGVALEDRTVD
ncbi:MAG: Chloride/fluoride channel protein [Phycisphaerae bacterium]|nr:Chloride/fluoride channel protein [Phycisphaerae bacterium]